MLTTLSFGSYRSLKDLWIPLSSLTVITGPNGSGKSNIFRALGLLKSAANGRFAEAIAQEGGMPGVLFAGPDDNRFAREFTEGGPRSSKITLRLGLAFEDFRFELNAGLPPQVPGDTSLFTREPDIKSELLFVGKRRPSAMLLERKNSVVYQGSGAQKTTLCESLASSQSLLSQLTDGLRFPELVNLRQRILSMRLYQEFRCDALAPVRSIQIGYRTPILADDGGNLASAIATILEQGNAEAFNASIENAFPGGKISVDRDERGAFHLSLHQHGLLRGLSVAELSDGTLRFLCLLSALHSTSNTMLMAFNEPEASLHPDLIRPLARQLTLTSKSTQILVMTHSQALANALEDFSESATLVLERSFGATKITGQGLLNTPTF